MGNRRTIAAFVAVALIVTMLGACGSSSKSSAKAQARTAAQAKAARAQVAAAKRRLAAARARVAAQRRALAAVVRRRQLQARAEAVAAAKRARAAATSTTTIPKVATPPTTPTTPTTHPPSAGPPPSRVATLAADLAAIAHTVGIINAAFAKGVAAGIAASEFANYYISAGVYSEGRCSASEAARGLGVVADHLVVRAGSVVPTPGWTDPVLHGVPRGRVYGLTMDDLQTQVETKQTRTQSISTHATVGPDGRAQLFFRC